MKVGIYTFSKFEGRKSGTTGSSKIRGDWVAKYWPEAEIFVPGVKYDAVIYQKAYHFEHAEAFKGVKILDMCDPDWMHWGYRIKQMIEACDAVTTSTSVLKEAVEQFAGNKPVIHVPDRIDLEKHKEKKIHIGDAKNIVWYGYSTNYDLLSAAVSVIAKFGLGLIVVSNSPYTLPMQYENKIELINYPWDYRNANSDIIKGDIVINPKSLKGRFRFKSNNKTIIAWALGMPVAHNADELEKFIPEEARKQESELRLKEVKEKYDVKLSVEQYKEIINKYAS